MTPIKWFAATIGVVIGVSHIGMIGMIANRKDAIIDNVKSKVMEAVMPDIGSGITDAIPDTTGPAVPLPF